MPPIVGPSKAAAASETRLSDLSGASTRTVAALHYHRPRLIQLPAGGTISSPQPSPLPLPQPRPPQLQPCPMDTVRRIFAEPFTPGSLVPLSPPPTKRFARRAALPSPSSPSSFRSKSVDIVVRGQANSACSIVPAPTPRKWSLDANAVIESPLEERGVEDAEKPEHDAEGREPADEDDEDEKDIARLRNSFAPKLDVALPSPGFSPFSFEDIDFASPPTPALTSTSLTSTPSTSRFSVGSASGSDSGLSSRRISTEGGVGVGGRLAPSDLPMLMIGLGENANISLRSYFSPDDEDGETATENGQHTPTSRRTLHPSMFENFIPPPLPPLKAASALFTSDPICTSPTSSTFDTDIEYFSVVTPDPTSAPPSPADKRENKRRKRHGRLMSLEDIHVVKQSFLPTDVMTDPEEYWI